MNQTSLRTATQPAVPVMSPSGSPQAQNAVPTRDTLHLYRDYFDIIMERRVEGSAVVAKQGQEAVQKVCVLHTQLRQLHTELNDRWLKQHLEILKEESLCRIPCCGSPSHLPHLPMNLSTIVFRYLDTSALYRLSPEMFERQKKSLDGGARCFSEHESVKKALEDVIATIATLHAAYNTLEETRQQLTRVTGIRIQ